MGDRVGLFCSCYNTGANTQNTFWMNVNPRRAQINHTRVWTVWSTIIDYTRWCSSRGHDRSLDQSSPISSIIRSWGPLEQIMIEHSPHDLLDHDRAHHYWGIQISQNSEYHTTPRLASLPRLRLGHNYSSFGAGLSPPTLLIIQKQGKGSLRWAFWLWQ